MFTPAAETSAGLDACVCCADAMNYERIVADLVDLSAQVPNRASFRSGFLEVVEQLVGFETALVARMDRRVGEVTALHVPAAVWHAFHTPSTGYREDVLPVLSVLKQRPVVVDSSDPSRARPGRLTFYAQLSRSIEGSPRILFADLTLRTAPGSLTMILTRRDGSRSEPREIERLLRVLPAIGLGECYWESRERAGATHEPIDAVSGLSPREREVLEYASLGLSNQDIALALGKSPHTVKHQLASLMRKFGAGTRAELVRFALLERSVEHPLPTPSLQGRWSRVPRLLPRKTGGVVPSARVEASEFDPA